MGYRLTREQIISILEAEFFMAFDLPLESYIADPYVNKTIKNRITELTAVNNN